MGSYISGALLTHTKRFLVLPGHEVGASCSASVHPWAAAHPLEISPDVWWPGTWILTNSGATVGGKTPEDYHSVDAKQTRLSGMILNDGTLFI